MLRELSEQRIELRLNRSRAFELDVKRCLQFVEQRFMMVESFEHGRNHRLEQWLECGAEAITLAGSWGGRAFLAVMWRNFKCVAFASRQEGIYAGSALLNIDRWADPAV